MAIRYVRGDIIDQLFARIESNGDPYWLLTDRLGSIRDVTDNSGTVKDTIAYDGFGNITSESNPLYRGWYTFTGRQYDAETEYLYYRARYYDPSIGRWTSQDPLGFAAGDSNLYRYVFNQPTNSTDPSGQHIYAEDDLTAKAIVTFLKVNKIYTKAVPVGKSGLHLIEVEPNSLIRAEEFGANQWYDGILTNPKKHKIVNFSYNQGKFSFSTKDYNPFSEKIVNPKELKNFSRLEKKDLQFGPENEVPKGPLAQIMNPLVKLQGGKDDLKLLAKPFLGGPAKENPGIGVDLGKGAELNGMHSWDPVIQQLKSGNEHVARKLIEAGFLRDLYHQGQQAIGQEAQHLLNSGRSEAEVAEWVVETRNNLKKQIRSQGEPIVDAIAQILRKENDYPTIESLRAKGKKDKQIIEGVTKSNPTADKWAGRLKIAGRIMLAVDFTISGYKIATAAEVDRPKMAIKEVSRFAGAVAAGWVGAKGGALLGGKIGLFFPPYGPAIGAAAGSIIFGIGGAIGGGAAAEYGVDLLLEELYPPSDTKFELMHRK